MSVDRFLYIYKPLQYERLVTKEWILVPMLIAWIVSICIGIASRLVGFRNINFQLSCTVDKGIIFVIFLILVGFERCRRALFSRYFFELGLIFKKALHLKHLNRALMPVWRGHLQNRFSHRKSKYCNPIVHAH